MFAPGEIQGRSLTVDSGLWRSTGCVVRYTPEGTTESRAVSGNVEITGAHDHRMSASFCQAGNYVVLFT